MTNLEQRIHELPPDRFARSAHAAAKLAVRSAKRAGKEPPASALWLLKQSPEQLQAQQQRRLQEESAGREQAEQAHDVPDAVGLLDLGCTVVGASDYYSLAGESLRAIPDALVQPIAVVQMAGGARSSMSGKKILVSAESGEDLSSKKTWKILNLMAKGRHESAHNPAGTLGSSSSSERQRQ